MSSPYRKTPPRARYSLTVDDELLEGDRFADIIRAMRERGYDTNAVSDAGMVAIRTARGGEVYTGRAPT